MKIKVFEFKNCSTCQKAIKFLDAKKIQYEKISIVDQPPTILELKRILGFLKSEGGSLKNLFNISGQQYRELNIAEKLKVGLSEDEALKILSSNGKLIKRPLILSETFGLVGFKSDLWAKHLDQYKN